MVELNKPVKVSVVKSDDYELVGEIVKTVKKDEYSFKLISYMRGAKNSEEPQVKISLVLTKAELSNFMALFVQAQRVEELGMI